MSKAKPASGPLTKADLTDRKPRTESVELGSGGYVTVRGLSRREVVEDVQGSGGGLAFERKLLSLGMVDPEMTEEDVAAWQEVSPAGDIDSVVLKVTQLSGLAKDGEKAAYRSFRGQPGS